MLARNSICLGDCLEVMKDIEDASVDLLIADPPYFDTKIKAVGDLEFADRGAYLSFIESFIGTASGKLKEKSNILFYASRQMSNDIQDILDRRFREQRVIIWARKRDFNRTRGRTLSSGYEPILWYSKGGDYTFNNIKVPPPDSLARRPEYRKGGLLEDGVSLSDVWTDIPTLPHNSGEKVAHPTQKPLKLCDRLVRLFSNEGDLVLVPFMGSGSEIIASIGAGRDYIGIEKEGRYFRIAEERIAAAHSSKPHGIH